MIRTFNIDEKEITLDGGVPWLYEYYYQFGHDILPDLLPAVSAILVLFEDTRVDTVKKAKAAVKSVLGTAGRDAIVELAGLQLTDFFNVIWAMAKAYDSKIPEPRVWYRQFERFPTEEIIPAAFQLIVESSASSKNWESLRETLSVLRAEANE